MRVILTHEQADFDALASLLAARLLDDTAVAVLPRRMNRNVRAFLTLYGAELPFVDPRDLGSETIKEATLVDTQSLITIKGMEPDLRVHAIDHHQPRENMPANWALTYQDVGANTTILVESLREENEQVTPIQATLLLLGIYEDTGSLTYTSTTPRDLRAAAYLLEHGASLQLAADFLNHPLSKEQQVIYDRLRSAAEHEHISGYTVIISTADVHEADIELSTIAHKLRDLLDPDALVLLIQTGGGVQLIARSTTDHIDVSELAEHFGGGGHDRAAASLIREGNLEEVYRELKRVLPAYVKPAVTAAQIMSRGPQVLSPETPVEEAAQRMRRFGYEGYPVVKNGRVVGLLTRRAVDRALSHKLNLPTSSLMDAGEVTIHPDDSIETLQRRMTDTGWGQIPVIDPETQTIIGIVTRTDLLKTLAPQTQLPHAQNLGSRLQRALPPARLELLLAVAQAAHQQRVALYIVGGFVRDLLLERPSLDFDLVVEGDAISLAYALAEKYGGRVTSHSRFGTAKWHLPLSAEGQPTPAGIDLLQGDLPESLDFVTARTEFYTYPTALPTVERGSIKLDLHRRDFTINTLALRLDGSHWGELHDYWGGLADLRQGLVRVLHSLSFVDDPTRMLRAVRFEQRFGFQIEHRTLQLLGEALSLLDRVSGDRLRHEINHILLEERVSQIMARLEHLNLLSEIHPSLTWDNWLESRFESLPTKEPDADWGFSGQDMRLLLRRDLGYVLWLLRLEEEEAQAICYRLKLPADLTESVLAAVRLWQDLPHLAEASPSEAVARLEDVPPLARYAIYRATSDIHLRKVLQMYVSRWQKVTPLVNGHNLRQRGLPPGPAYRRILEELRRAWLDGIISTPEEEAALLETLIEKENEVQES